MGPADDTHIQAASSLAFEMDNGFSEFWIQKSTLEKRFFDAILASNVKDDFLLRGERRHRD